MINDNAGGAGNQNDNSGGAGGNGGSGNDDGSGRTGDDKPIAKADHQRALDDMHRFKREARESAARADALAAEIAQSKAVKDQETGNFKSLWESEKTARTEAEAKAERLMLSVKQSERSRAVYPALKKAGLRDDTGKLLEKLELDDIEIEFTSSGKINCLGVETFVEKVKRDHPYAFEVKKAPRTNSGGGSNAGGNGPANWTPDSLFAFEQKCRKNGDMGPYRDAVAEYQAKKQSQ